MEHYYGVVCCVKSARHLISNFKEMDVIKTAFYLISSRLSKLSC